MVKGIHDYKSMDEGSVVVFGVHRWNPAMAFDWPFPNKELRTYAIYTKNGIEVHNDLVDK
jgi:hypothetical protein